MGLFSSKATSADAGPSPLVEYKVIYKGGLPGLPKAKVSGIMMAIWPDRIHFEPTASSKKFWQPLTVPLTAVSDLQVVTRQVGTGEALLSGSRGTRSLEQDNNIHLHYTDPSGQAFVLRVEMLTGVTVTGQAKKCAEMLDLIQVNNLRQHFATRPIQDAQPSGIAEEIRRLAELHAQGVLSDDEFAVAKARLLGA